jgi:RHS repeat-associated protein
MTPSLTFFIARIRLALAAALVTAAAAGGTFRAWAQENNNPPTEARAISASIPPPQEIMPSKYRKIALNGMPLSDEKPQAAEETDQTKEETYIDALTLNLTHSTTDIYVPVPTSDGLALSVQRNAVSESWVAKSIERPDLRPVSPFGVGWSSSIGANLRIYRTMTRSQGSHRSQMYVYVTDPQGGQHRFLMVAGNFSQWEPEYDTDIPPQPTNPLFIPFPSGNHEGDAAATSLKLLSDSNGPYYEFKQKYGTTCIYRPAQAHTQNFTTVVDPCDPEAPTSITYTNEANNYSRVEKVIDRYGNTLNYLYTSNNLIPYEIQINNSTTRRLLIESSSGRVTKVTDPEGAEYVYTYESKTLGGSNFSVLSKVEWDSGSTEYTYDLAEETDLTPFELRGDGVVPKYHCDLKTIKDGRGNTYTFTYAYDQTKESYSDTGGGACSFQGFFKITGLPRYVTAVQLPNGATSQFELHALVQGNCRADNSAQIGVVFGGYRFTYIKDAAGNSRLYSFTGNNLFPINEVEHDTSRGESNDYKPVFIVYDQMKIEFFQGTGTVNLTTVNQVTTAAVSSATLLGNEVVGFNSLSSFALGSLQDFSGNTTTYAYTDEKPELIGRFYNPNGALLAPNYTDPNSQTNALNGTKTFTYDANFRVMKKIVDEAGRVTEYTVDTMGRRTKELIKASATGDVLHETDFAYANSTFPAFMTKKTVKDYGKTGDPSWVDDLVTDYVPDSDGQVWKEIVDPAGLALTIIHTYDKNGNRLSTTDPRGNTTYFGYDDRNRLVKTAFPPAESIDDAAAPIKTLVYDDAGNKIKETTSNYEYDSSDEIQASSLTTLFEYDSLNRLTAQVQDMNRNGVKDTGTDLITSFTYNHVNSKLTVTDPNGNTTTMEYDALQRLKKTIDALAKETTFEYDKTKNTGASNFDVSAFKPTKTTDPRGYVTEITYDKLYRATEKKVQYKLGTSPLYAVTKTVYDAVGNPTQQTVVIDPADTSKDQVTVTDYDGMNRPIKVTNADTTYQEMFYTATGLKWKVKDELARETLTKYDLAGRPTEVHAPAVDDGTGTSTVVSPITKTVYDANGNVLKTINPLNREWHFVYDERNRKTQEKQPGSTGVPPGPTTTTEYDFVGRVLKVTDPLNNVTSTTYDDAGRVVTVKAPPVPILPSGTARPTTTSEYDKNGNVLKITDPDGRIVANTYDALNRLLTTTQDPNSTGYTGLNIIVTNTYDEVGNKTKVKDGKNQETLFEYDGLNRNTKITDPAANFVTFGFNPVNKISRTDSLDQVTNYTYDKRNRLTAVEYVDRSQDNRAYAYDNVGNLLSVTETNHTIANVSYTYDALNRQITETSGGLTHAYVYDLAGNRVKTTYGGTSRVLTSTYDVLNRLKTLTDGTRVTTYNYDDKGNITSKVLPNSETVTMTYDALSRLQTSATDNYGFTNSYDLVGNVVKMVEVYPNSTSMNRTVANTYDKANRLTEEAVTGSGAAMTVYAYDKAHNRTSRAVTTTGTVTTTYTYNGLNQLTESTGGTNATYNYDVNGNRTMRIVGNDEHYYHYDYENRLVSVEISGVLDPRTFDYDYRARRIKRDDGTTVTKFVFSGGTSVQEYDGTTPSLTVEYVRGSDYGGGIGGVLYTLRGTTPSYNHYNRRGDVIGKSDSSGDSTYQATYEAFGTRTSEIGSTQDRQKANTKDEEPELGLLNEGFRYRDLETGSFITRDPLGFVDGPNMYSYVVANPWTNFDPDGLETIKPKMERVVKNSNEVKKLRAQLKDTEKKSDQNKIERQIKGLEKDIKNDIKGIEKIEKSARFINENIAEGNIKSDHYVNTAELDDTSDLFKLGQEGAKTQVQMEIAKLAAKATGYSAAICLTGGAAEAVLPAVLAKIGVTQTATLGGLLTPTFASQRDAVAYAMGRLQPGLEGGARLTQQMIRGLQGNMASAEAKLAEFVGQGNAQGAAAMQNRISEVRTILQNGATQPSTSQFIKDSSNR